MTERHRAPPSCGCARNLSLPPKPAARTATIPSRSSTTGTDPRSPSGRPHSEKSASRRFVPRCRAIASPGRLDRTTSGKRKASARIPGRSPAGRGSA